jgi:hypothetical protein
MHQAAVVCRTTAIVHACCILFQLLAIVCFRVGYSVTRADLNTACCVRTDFSNVGALRTSMKDAKEEYIWNMYCTMTACACDFDSQTGTLRHGAFFAVAVAAWATGAAVVAVDQVLARPRAAEKQ